VKVDSERDLAVAAETLGWPIVLKTRRMGYDGRGQRILDSAAQLVPAWTDLGRVPSIAEAWVRFDREVSLIAVQGADRQRAFYPLAENVHRDGILQTTVAPYADAALQKQAEDWLGAIMGELDYRGVLTVEFFHTKTGLVANEMAPRVHNSGHWTIEGAETSQFENHLRAVLGWPLGDTRVRGHAAMLNLLGTLPSAEVVLAIPGAHFHDYGKDPRPGRKVGHCTLVDPDRDRLIERFRALRQAVAVPEQ
jgi:5-(carboxyamino)imidazole ribonucleotide synthase